MIEAAILATRVEFLPSQQIFEELEQLASPVEKTGGMQEREAWNLVRDYIRKQLVGCEKSEL